ncbi:hypothetical protein CWC53_03805 [Enterococcus faecium]|nr:hypothetical protein CWC53_03805 [Enterococcus faecium]
MEREYKIFCVNEKIHTKKEVPSIEIGKREAIHIREDFPMNQHTFGIMLSILTPEEFKKSCFLLRTA